MQFHLKSLVFMTGIFAAAPVSAYAEGALVFSEVYPDDGSASGRREYLRVVNRGDTPLELTNWVLTTKSSAQGTGALVRFPALARLRPGQSFLIAFDESALYENSPELVVDAHLFEGSGIGYTLTSGAHPSWGSGGALSLPTSEQRLLIVAPDGTISDGIAWGSGSHPSASPLPVRGDKTKAWRREFITAESGPLGGWTLVQQDLNGAPLWACSPAICGNGFLEGDETCDDGNTTAGDGCSSTCAVETGAFCVHNELPCGGTSVRPTHCYFPGDVCKQPLLLTAVHLWSDEGAGYQCQDWYEFKNASSEAFPLHALKVTEDLRGGLGSFAGRDAFAPGQWLSGDERAVVLDRLNPLLRVAERYPAEGCPLGPATGFSHFFGPAPPRWFARWTASLLEATARWDDRAPRHGVQLNPVREQLSAYCQHDNQNFDVFAFAQDGKDEGERPANWSGPRARWYPELLRYNVVQSVVFRRFPESQDTNTKADWHLSRCPAPGQSPEHRETPIVGASVVRQLPADGTTVRVELSSEARLRSDGQIWVVPPHDPRVEVLASEGSLLFRNITTPEIFDVEWFALTPCWVSEKYTAQVRFGDAVRCFPDTDADGYGDARAAGVVVEGSCGAGFVSNANDCDDSQASVHPGARDRCDGVDNDCNPATADGSGEAWFDTACDGSDTDLCEDGRMLCVFATQYCLENGPDNVDFCDGIDNDCNPATPDGAHDPRVHVACDGTDPDRCTDGLTICASGTVTCAETTPPGRVELCDGLDNDCNPGTPDGYSETLFGKSCSVGVGACMQSSSYTCQAASMVCPVVALPPSQNDASCDGIDNDCNGLVDDGVPETAIRCGVGACESVGVERCEDGRFVAECTPHAPTMETFESGRCEDGIDNDCDGLTDALDPDCQPLRACYYDADGDGYPGTAVELRVPDCDGTWAGNELWEVNFDCNDDPNDACATKAWNGSVERCDGCDNDCNGKVDETFPTLGKSCAMEGDHCSVRQWECNDSGDALTCGENTREPRPDDIESVERGNTCNDGIDNDCDGLVDDEDPDCTIVHSGGRLFGCSSNETPATYLFAIIAGGLIVARRRSRARQA